MAFARAPVDRIEPEVAKQTVMRLPRKIGLIGPAKVLYCEGNTFMRPAEAPLF